jgi:hypothetical protein
VRVGWDRTSVTDPSLTAIDLASFDCADSIDIALRTRSATLAGMHEALRLTRKRRGNAERERLLLDSRENRTWRMLQEHPDVFIAAIRAELH